MCREEWCSSCLMRSSRLRIRRGSTSPSPFNCWTFCCWTKVEEGATCIWGWWSCCWERWWCINVPFPSPINAFNCALGSQMFSRELFFEPPRLNSKFKFPTAHSCNVLRRISSLILPEGVLPVLRFDVATAFLNASRMSSWYPFKLLSVRSTSVTALPPAFHMR